MIGTSEAAQRLGITETRVRALLASGKLTGKKIGRTWIVSEQSVERRKRQGSYPGRPKKGETREAACSSSDDPSFTDSSEIASHRLYLECRDTLSHIYDSAFLERAASSEEERFYVHVATFFLQEKQRHLIDQGVF